MSYQVVFSRAADRYLDRLDSVMKRGVVERIDEISERPRSPLTKPLQGPDRLSTSRVGGLRIIFEIDDASAVILVHRIAPRGQVYRRPP